MTPSVHCVPFYLAHTNLSYPVIRILINYKATNANSNYLAFNFYQLYCQQTNSNFNELEKLPISPISAAASSFVECMSEPVQ